VVSACDILIGFAMIQFKTAWFVSVRMHCGLNRGVCVFGATHAKSIHGSLALTMKLFFCLWPARHKSRNVLAQSDLGRISGFQKIPRGEHRNAKVTARIKRRGTANRYERNWHTT